MLMLTIQACQRLGAATVISGLMLVVGCRSASVNSSPVATPVPRSVGGLPFYRSYEKPARPYDDVNSDQYQSPEPDPPSVLPAPGYSEPPTPSAKKSRWNLNNAGLKFPSFSLPNKEVRQTGVNSERAVSKKSAKSSPATSNGQPVEEEEEEVVHSRFTPEVIPPKLSSKVLPIAPRSAGDMPLLLPPGN